MFLFTPLLGAQSNSQACQSLLELDNGIKILVDVGWDESFDEGLLAELERHTPTIDLVLLTHPTLAHMGAYAHACKHIPTFSSIPVYSTFPVSNLGRLLLQDIYLSTALASTRLQDRAARSPPALPAGQPPELPANALKLPPTSAEIDSYCTKIVTLKYSQPTPLHAAAARVSGKLGSIIITAYSAGHSLGGTIWKIQQAQEVIVYAVDWNHSRENCLRGAGFLSGGGGVSVETLGKPTALICSAKNSEVANVSGGRKRRDEMLLETIRKTAVEMGGTVLIPTDSVGRVLELVYLLEHAWRSDQELSSRTKGKGVGLFLAGRRVRRLGQVVGSMLEWMDEGVVREFESIAGADRRGNRQRDDTEGKGNDGNKAGPFDFLHLNLVSTQGHLNRILSDGGDRGKVIIASDSSLEWGFSREALMKLASNEKNLVVLTERADGKQGWAGSLWEQWKDRASKSGGEKAAGWQDVSLEGEQIQLEIPHRTPLQGEELESYNRHHAAQEALSSQHQSLLSNSGLPSAIGAEPDDDDASSSSDDDSDSERQGKALTTANSKKISAATVMLGGATPSGYGSGKVDIGVNILLRGKGVYDYDVRGAKGRNRMFPFVTRRRRVDEYGEVIRAEEYMRAEEKAEEDLLDAADIRQERVMGKKRKWDENEGRRGPHGARKLGKESADSGGKKRRIGKPKSRPEGDDGYEPDDGETEEVEEGEVEEDEAEDEEAILAMPSKVTFSTVEVVMNSRVVFIDFAGLHDSRSLRMLLPLIGPRKLILTAGRESETKILANDCRKLLSGRGALSGRGESGTGTDVFLPEIGNRVNAGVDTNAWVIKLSDGLVRGLKWQNVRGLGVVHVVGRITHVQELNNNNHNDNTTSKKKQKLSESPEAEADPLPQQQHKPSLLLDTLPPHLAASTRTIAQPIHVGDIRLADLRRVLLALGLTAEFRGEGTLLIDGVVAVRKSGVGSVIIEDGGGGSVKKGRTGLASGSTSFVEVRRRVYEGLAVVSGG